MTRDKARTGAECRTVIAGSGLNEHVPKRRVRSHLSVRDAVHPRHGGIAQCQRKQQRTKSQIPASSTMPRAISPGGTCAHRLMIANPQRFFGNNMARRGISRTAFVEDQMTASLMMEDFDVQTALSRMFPRPLASLPLPSRRKKAGNICRTATSPALSASTTTPSRACWTKPLFHRGSRPDRPRKEEQQSGAEGS